MCGAPALRQSKLHIVTCQGLAAMSQLSRLRAVRGYGEEGDGAGKRGDVQYVCGAC